MVQSYHMTSLRTKKIIIIGLLFFVFLLVGIFFGEGTVLQHERAGQNVSNTNIEHFEYQTIEQKIHGEDLVILVADDADKRELGLGLLDNLNDYDGMLFVFEKSGIYPFWMKGMQFPIDIFWLDEKGVIVHMEKNAHPDDFPQKYTLDADSRYVLELAGGSGDKYGLNIGEKIDLNI